MPPGRAAKPYLAALVLCACALPLPAQTVRSAAPFQLMDVSCTSVQTGPTSYPDPSTHDGLEKLQEVFGENSRPIGIVGRRDGGNWTMLPRFYAVLRVWPGNGKPPASNIASYLLRAPDRQRENLNAVAINVFSLHNPEVLLKVFVGAGPFGGLDAWVFAAAATDLPMELRLWDVDTRRLATWSKGGGPATALTDTTTMLGSDCFACRQDPYC